MKNNVATTIAALGTGILLMGVPVSAAPVLTASYVSLSYTVPLGRVVVFGYNSVEFAGPGFDVVGGGYFPATNLGNGAFGSVITSSVPVYDDYPSLSSASSILGGISHSLSLASTAVLTSGPFTIDGRDVYTLPGWAAGTIHACAASPTGCLLGAPDLFTIEFNARGLYTLHASPGLFSPFPNVIDSVQFTSVPEPGTFPLACALFVAGLPVALRRRSNPR